MVVLGFRRDDVAGYVDRQVMELPQVIISDGWADAGLALAPEAMVRAMESRVDRVCEDE